MIFKIPMPDFSRRIFSRELMDDYSSNPQDLYVTLGHFSLINALFSRTTTLFRRHIFSDIQRRGLKAVTIMDVGAGGGDFARYLVRFLKNRAITAKIICLDNDSRVISYLKTSCKNYPTIKIVPGSAFDLCWIQGDIDYCISNNVMHHSADNEISGFISSMHERAHYGILINDIARSAFAYVGFKAFASVFLRKGFTLRDGLMSIRKGFTLSELRMQINRAGLTNSLRIGRAAPGNIYIVGTKP